jgi:hypothetical protein
MESNTTSNKTPEQELLDSFLKVISTPPGQKADTPTLINLFGNLMKVGLKKHAEKVGEEGEKKEGEKKEGEKKEGEKKEGEKKEGEKKEGEKKEERGSESATQVTSMVDFFLRNVLDTTAKVAHKEEEKREDVEKCGTDWEQARRDALAKAAAKIREQREQERAAKEGEKVNEKEGEKVDFSFGTMPCQWSPTGDVASFSCCCDTQDEKEVGEKRSRTIPVVVSARRSEDKEAERTREKKEVRSRTIPVNVSQYPLHGQPSQAKIRQCFALVLSDQDESLVSNIVSKYFAFLALRNKPLNYASLKCTELNIILSAIFPELSPPTVYKLARTLYANC